MENGLELFAVLAGYMSAMACSEPDSALALMKRSVDAFNSGNREERDQISSQFHSLVLSNFSEERLKAICNVLKRNDTHVVPTLTLLKGIYFINDTTFTNDKRKHYLSNETLEYWRDVEIDDMKSNSSQNWINKRRRWEVEQQIMRILISEKVKIMAGTDCDNPYAFPGFSIHDEMVLFVKLGMTPLEALRSATSVPAEFMKMSDSIGSVSKGKLADLVLLNANPLEAISNTTNIHAVIANGELYDQRYISAVLDR